MDNFKREPPGAALPPCAAWRGSLLVALKRIVLNVVGLKERATSGCISNCLRLTIDLAWFCEPLGLLQGLGTANLFRSEAAAWLIVPIKER